ncbi:MAG: extracellular solute-binding protein [Lachnospiraceae bacterium]|nr:extracellular solute-binding protein [Lachnospiraceae bacterium]
MKLSKKKLIVLVAVVVVIATLIVVRRLRYSQTYEEKYAGTDLSADVEGLGRGNTYTKYMEKYGSKPLASQGAVIDCVNDLVEGTGTEVKAECDGVENVLLCNADSLATWKVSVPESGLYNISLTYYTVKSLGVDVERTLYINGELPFLGAESMTFSRCWTDGGPKTADNRGNEIRPSQVEAYRWQTQFCKDYLGYVVQPYRFYLEKGENTISLKAENEPVILKNITLSPIEADQSYAKYAAENANRNNSNEAKNTIIKINGEDADFRSDASLYARYDKSVPNTDPYSITEIKLNYIGGEQWKIPGQWIEWEFNVPAEGYYRITLKGRQSYQRGALSCRSLYIDGKVPFEEVEAIEFAYSNDWEMLTLCDADENPYQFYLTEGKHSIRLEATLGDVGSILDTLNDNVYRLNQMYREIIILTGTSPDTFRDYHLDKVYPEVIQGMDLEYKRLYKVVDDYTKTTGQKSDKIATALTLAIQMEDFMDDTDDITKSLTTFKNNIASLGTSMLEMSQTMLDIDYILLQGTDTDEVKDSSNIFSSAWHGIKSFFASFFVDYNAVGNVYEDNDDEVIEVWLLSGRDQNQVMKMMVDDTFTPNSGIKVNVQVISADALLNATMSGNGPDVVLTADAQKPVDYALRNAVEDLTQFPDYKEVLSEYPESSYTSYWFEGGLYGLPETLNYNVMFYRKDILEELGIKIEDLQTWEDLINVLPTIQGSNMEVALPTVERIIGNANNPDLSLYFTLVHQNGGTFYNDDATKIMIDNNQGVEAFEMFTSFFNDYGLPLQYDFPSRFRSGEMPIGITDYNTYNTLVVSAPEIRGLWDFTLIPGTRRIDETGNEIIDRTVHCWGTSSIMLKQDNEKIKQNAWTFMKWWASSETQTRFGRELEAVMGSSARYATANLESFKELPWTAKQRAVLDVQRDWTRGFREVAGGYYTSRHITNASRKVMNQKEDPREVLLDYVRTINEEITKKRKEYGLKVLDERSES